MERELLLSADSAPSSEGSQPEDTLSKKEESKPEVVRGKKSEVENESQENGKRKPKEEKAPMKVVIRRLPPSMTKAGFEEQVSPIPPVDYMYFVPADLSLGVNAFSRVYLNFISTEDLLAFRNTFDGYVFLDAKGQEYPAIVEFAAFQRIPKAKPNKKKDTLMGTIESDPTYIAFKEAREAEVMENTKPGSSVKQHYFETEAPTTPQEEIASTPLLDFLKQRRAEKARIKEERREEKKRKEAERKQKLRSKEKKTETEEESTEVKVLQPSPKERKEGRDVRSRRREEKKEKDTRTREFKNRSGKNFEEKSRPVENKEGLTDGGQEGVPGTSGEIKVRVFESKTFGRSQEGEKADGERKTSGRGNNRKEKREEHGTKKNEKQKEKVGRKRPRASKKPANKGEEAPQPAPETTDHKPEQKPEIEEREKRVIARRNSYEVKGSEEEVKGKQRRSSLGDSDHKKADDGQNSAQNNDKSERVAKDPRTERRIRNKDRPSIEIYRPGMGRFSKQRMEKEKVATGSSTEMESPSHSPSPSANSR